MADDILLTFSPLVESSVQGDTGARKFTFPGGWVPSVGDEVTLTFQPSGEKHRLVCIHRHFDLSREGEFELTILLDLPDHAASSY